MKNTLKCLLVQLAFLISLNSYAQVGIGTALPDDSSILDISSTDKGILMPRLSTGQRDAIVLPATGLMIYNITMNDGQLNVGTTTVPVWIGMKGSETPFIDTVTEGGSVSTTSNSDIVVEGMFISPSSGTYMILFNAQMSSSQTFSSATGDNDMSSLYDELMAYPGGVPHALTFGSGETLTPGVYDVSGAPSIAGTLTMNGGGDPDAIFIIRGSGAFTTGISTTVVLTGSAKSENIFWVSGAAMSTAANTTMKGTMLGGGAGAGAVSLGANSNLEGRLLTKLGAVSLAIGDVITTPTGVSLLNLGVLSTFAMWSSDGAVSDVLTSTTTGDVGTAVGALTMIGTHTGEKFPANTTSSPSTTSYSIYQDGIEVVDSSRELINVHSSIVSLQAKVIVIEGETIDIRWKVDSGESIIDSRTLAVIRTDF
jgi:hypothetical protein